ncbi:group-specific protein [Bacillus infantis]|uniref:group-specific protein n=1 Tax=Bacillus infantis TaxID=324767 RepID=UPI003CF1B107
MDKIDVNIDIDEHQVYKILTEQFKEHIRKKDLETLFWSSQDLIKQTRLSWTTIQTEFFHDQRFPKSKVGRKWLFPAEKTKEFLLEWLEERRY